MKSLLSSSNHFFITQAYSTAKNVRKDIDAYDVKFITHFGDISYARGYAYIWEQWGWLIEPVATLVPYMLGIGELCLHLGTVGLVDRTCCYIGTLHAWNR